MGVRCRDFKIWQTDRQVLNAAVAGLLPSMRYVFVTDALLLYLRDDEMEAVIAHELGHVRRRHLLLRLLLLSLPLWIAANFQAFSPQVTDWVTAWRSGFTGDPGSPVTWSWDVSPSHWPSSLWDAIRVSWNMMPTCAYSMPDRRKHSSRRSIGCPISATIGANARRGCIPARWHASTCCSALCTIPW